MNGQRFCVDCRHYQRFNPGGYAPPWCVFATNREPTDPVYGRRIRLIAAAMERQNVNGCGPTGKHWEPRILPWWRRWLGSR